MSSALPTGVADLLRNSGLLYSERPADLLRKAGRFAPKNAASLYVWGKPICARCAVLIIQAGIKRIIATNPEDEMDKNSPWYKSGVLAVKMFTEVDMEMTWFKVPITAKH
jgi:deoxycytidylate deaminase